MTARWTWLPDVDPCGISIGRGQTCQLAGDDPHQNGCQAADSQQDVPLEEEEAAR